MLIILFYDPLIIKIPNTRTYQILIYTQQNYYRGNFSDSGIKIKNEKYVR